MDLDEFMRRAKCSKHPEEGFGHAACGNCYDEQKEDIAALRRGEEADKVLLKAAHKEVRDLREENKRLREIKGVACLEHDLVHNIQCGVCYGKLEAKVQRLEAVVEEVKRIASADPKDRAILDALEETP